MGLIEFFHKFLDIMLHLEQYLGPLVAQYGGWTYLILFGIIFLETGLVLTPFLPGDSLLFAVGTMASVDIFNIWLLFAIFVSAAILGDTCNYFIGEILGKKMIRSKSHLIKKEYIDQTKAFFKKHGSKTIILARFIPIVRTFAPFMAGVGRMNYWTFLVYNVVGAFLWVGVFLFVGYFFGQLTIVQENFSKFVIGIVLVSFLPLVWMWGKDLYNKMKHGKPAKKHAKKRKK